MSDSRPTSKLAFTVRLIVAVVVPGLLLWIIARLIVGQWSEIRNHEWHPVYWAILVATAVGWVDFILINQLWRRVLIIMSGRDLPFLTAYRIAALSNLGKYLPGKVWAFLGMMFMLRNEGYGAHLAFGSTIWHQALTILAGLAFTGAIIGTEFTARIPLWVIIAAVASCLVMLHPSVLTRLMNFGLRILRRDPVNITLPFSKGLMLFVLYGLAWLLYGSSFWFLVWGLGFPPGPFWVVTASFAAAYLIGFLALFAPGGVGVREGILVLLLSPIYGAGVAALISVVSRVWMTALEVVQLTPIAFRRDTWRSFSSRGGKEQARQ